MANLDYAQIPQDVALTKSKKATMYDNMLAKFDMVWGGNEVIYHRSNDKISLRDILEYQMLAQLIMLSSYPSWGYMVPPRAPKSLPDLHPLSLSGLGDLV